MKRYELTIGWPAGNEEQNKARARFVSRLKKEASQIASTALPSSVEVDKRVRVVIKKRQPYPALEVSLRHATGTVKRPESPLFLNHTISALKSLAAQLYQRVGKEAVAAGISEMIVVLAIENSIMCKVQLYDGRVIEEDIPMGQHLIGDYLG